MIYPEMFQQIQRHGILPIDDSFSAKKRTKMVLDHLPNIVVFDVGNVAEFMQPQERFRLESSCPNLAPIFPMMWMEHVHFDGGGIRRVGNFFRSYELDRSNPNNDAMAFLIQCTEVGKLDSRVTDVAGTPKWATVALQVLELNNKTVIGPVMSWIAIINEDGVLAKTSTGVNVSIMQPMVVASESPIELADEANALFWSLAPSLMAISFMHCKNVAQVGGLPTRQQRREMKRRNEPIITFKTLEIEPMRKVLETEGGIRQSGLKKALHICRGHFSHYSEDKPLFGKYAGQFWIPAHVRGTTEAGQVIKDYKVKAPRNVSNS